MNLSASYGEAFYGAAIFLLAFLINVVIYHFNFNLHFKIQMLMLKMVSKFYVIILILCILLVKYLSKSFVRLLIRLLLLLLLIFGRFCIIYIHFTFLNMWFTNTSTPQFYINVLLRQEDNLFSPYESFYTYLADLILIIQF